MSWQSSGFSLFFDHEVKSKTASYESLWLSLLWSKSPWSWEDKKSKFYHLKKSDCWLKNISWRLTIIDWIIRDGGCQYLVFA